MRSRYFAGLFAVLLLPTASAAAITMQAPVATIDSFVEGQAVYHVYGTAHTDQKHDRTEGVVILDCGRGRPDHVDFVKDYAGARTDFVSPTATFIVLDDQTCNITISWLIGGGGIVGESGVSPPTKITTISQRLDPRYSDDTKSAARSLRDSARRAAAKNYGYVIREPGLAALLVPAAVESALGSVANKIANDPVDPHFRTPVKRRAFSLTPLTAAQVGSAAAAMNQWVKAGADAVASGIALTTAIDRAQGARASKRKADRKRYDRSQMLVAAALGKRMAGELKTLRARQAAAAAALRACGCPLATMTVTNADWVNVHDLLAVNPTPAALAAPLRAAHLPATQIKAVASDLSNVDQLLPGTLPDEMDNVQELHTIDNLRDALATWSKAAKRHPTATPPS